MNAPVAGLWTTNYRGATYALTETGSLTRTGPTMSRAHIDAALQERRSNAATAVHQELLALAVRRAQQHAREQEHDR